jgi:tetratricopeptide (TPR) repeat protein
VRASAFALPKRFVAAVVLVGLLAGAQPAKADFWSKGQPQTVKLIRKLPPVSLRNGSTVRFVPEIAGGSIPPDTAILLREKIRTLLLSGKAGGIQLVDGPADTILKCIITGYEPKVQTRYERQEGNEKQQVSTWIGNIEASVQVLDGKDNPLDAANLKYHMENDFVVAKQEQKVTSVTDKRASWRDKLAGAINTVKGGDKGDVASLAGGGQQVHDAVQSGATGKGGREPTQEEWRSALIEGLAAKVANRIVPVDQEFVAVLPVEKEFTQVRELAAGGRWGDVQEQLEKMGQLSNSAEAYRQYTLALSYEALAYQDAGGPEKATDLLNKATKFYGDALKAKPSDREILLAQIRAQDSLDHYLEIQHYLANRPKEPVAPPVPVTTLKTPDAAPSATIANPSAPSNATDNAALIKMASFGLSDDILIAFVKTAPDPKFDVTGNGLIQLATGKVSQNVIKAVLQRMQASSTPAPAHRASAATKPNATVPAAK